MRARQLAIGSSFSNARRNRQTEKREERKKGETFTEGRFPRKLSRKIDRLIESNRERYDRTRDSSERQPRVYLAT